MGPGRVQQAPHLKFLPLCTLDCFARGVTQISYLGVNSTLENKNVLSPWSLGLWGTVWAWWVHLGLFQSWVGTHMWLLHSHIDSDRLQMSPGKRSTKCDFVKGPKGVRIGPPILMLPPSMLERSI